MARLRDKQAADPLDVLTEQERRILDLIGEGLTNRQIGERLFLAEKTVKNHVSSVLSKLGLQRRTQAAVLVTERRHGPPVTAETSPGVVLPQLRLDDLLEELQHRLADVRSTRDRVHALLEAVLAVGSDLDLQTVLRRITEAASTLAGARYAALGVIGDDARLSQFVTVGINDEAARPHRAAPRAATASSACSSATRGRCASTTSRAPRGVRLPARPPADDARSSACRSGCATRSSATST